MDDVVLGRGGAGGYDVVLDDISAAAAPALSFGAALAATEAAVGRVCRWNGA